MLGKKLQSLSGLIKVLIISHDNPDPDSIASSWGLAHILKKELGIKPTIAYGGLLGRAENRAMVSVLKIPLVQFSPLILKNSEAILMVDCQPYTGNSTLPEEIIPDVVIDHHPFRETTKYKQWAYFDDKIGATSTIIVSAIRERNFSIPKRLATALFYAIRSETKDLGWEGTRQDYENYLFLLPKLDFKALYHISYPPLSSAYYRSVKDALERSMIYKFVIICPLENVPYPELPAEIADFLIFKENIDFSLVIGYYEGDLFISIRSFRRDVNSADLMQSILKGYGRGGGHETTAGGKISNVPFYKLKEIEKMVIKRFLKSFSLSHVKGEKLV